MNNGRYICELCGEPSSLVAGEGEDFEYGTLAGPFRYVRCVSCKHMFLGNRPKRGQLSVIYPGSYYTINPESPLFLKGFIYEKKIRMDVKRIGRHLEGRDVKSIADIGCGDCRRLIALKNRLGRKKMELTGIDLQFSAETRARAGREEIRLLEGSVESDTVFSDPGVKFDMILLSQLLEHLFAPGETLGRLFEVLSPHGIILIETPNWQCLDYFLFRKRYWGGYHLPRHFNVFSPSSLARLVTEKGFKVIRQGFLPSPGFWILSFRNWLGLNSKAYSKSKFEFFNFSNLPVVGAFSLFDRVLIACKGKTSNQYLLAQRPG